MWQIFSFTQTYFSVPNPLCNRNFPLMNGALMNASINQQYAWTKSGLIFQDKLLFLSGQLQDWKLMIRHYSQCIEE